MKIIAVLCPNLKKNWIHFDLALYKEGTKDFKWLSDDQLSVEWSNAYGGYAPPYPAFRPDVDFDVKEVLEDSFDMSLFNLRFPVFEQEIVSYNKDGSINFKNHVYKAEDVVAIKFMGPLYYCKKSGLFWQSPDEQEVVVDDMIIYKEYKKGTKAMVCECQRTEKNVYSGV